MHTASDVTPISENPKQPQQRQTTKELIAANVQSLIEQLEAGKSRSLTAYLNGRHRATLETSTGFNEDVCQQARTSYT